MTINDLLTMPLIDLAGGTVVLSAVAASTVAFVKWVIAQIFRRVETREASVDGSTDRLLTGTLGWAEDLQNWAHKVEQSLADCMAREEKHIEENARNRQEIAELRAQLNARGAIAQEAAKVAAVHSLARTKSVER